MSAIIYYLELFLGGYIALTIALFTVSLQVPAAGFFARSLASYFGLLISSIYAFFVSIVLRLFGQSRSAQAASGRGIKYVLKYLIGVTFKVEDPNNYLNTVRPAVFIGNHQTELDVLMLGTIFPKYCSVTAKKSLKYIPFLGWFMALSNTVFIDRANAVSARSAMAGAAEEIKREKQSVYIFPEGTRSYAKEPVLLPFKKGAFHLAVQAGVPIVPVVVANYSNVLYVQGRVFKSGEIPVKVLKPIETKNLTSADVDDLARDTREVMLKELIRLTEQARGHPISIPDQDLTNRVVKASGAKVAMS